MDTIKQLIQSSILTDGSATFSGTVVSDPTATNVAGYAYEVKNGATSLGGLYKTTSNGGFLQLNNGSGTQTASINGEDGSAAFNGNTTVNTGSGGDATLELRMGTAGGGANNSCIQKLCWI